MMLADVVVRYVNDEVDHSRVVEFRYDGNLTMDIWRGLRDRYEDGLEVLNINRTDVFTFAEKPEWDVFFATCVQYLDAYGYRPEV